MILSPLCSACVSVAVLVSPLPPERPGGTGGPEIAAPAPKAVDDRTLLELIIDDIRKSDAETSAVVQPPAAARPTETSQQAPAPADKPIVAAAPGGPENVPLPPQRPAAVLALATRSRAEARSGQPLCGDPRLEGEMVAPISGGIAACGIAAPIRLTGVSGIRLTSPARLTCETARTFADWLTVDADARARQVLGSGIKRVGVMASYACRTRNHRKGARLSEHAYGRAIDIGSFTLRDGQRLSVLRHWNSGAEGRYLRHVWNRACGPFKTVLGPEADRFHLDHFHFDTAQRRSTYCR